MSVLNKFLVLLLVLLAGKEAIAQNSFNEPYFEYFIDSGNVATVDIPKQQFIPHTRSPFVYQNSHPLWFRVVLPPATKASELQFSSALIDSISLYAAAVEHRGELVNDEDDVSSSLFPSFFIEPHSDSVTLTFRLVSRDELLVFSILNAPSKQLNKAENRYIFIMAAFVCSMLIVFMLNFFVSLQMRDRLSIYFTFFSFFTCLFVLTLSGLSGLISGTVARSLDYLSIPLLGGLIISAIFLTIRVVQIRILLPWLYRLLVFISAFIVANIVFYFLGWEKNTTLIINSIGGITVPMYMYASWVAYKQGQRYALYYVIGWGLYYAAMVYLLLLMYGVVVPGINSIYITPVISMIDFLFISITIIGKVNHYKSEKEKAGIRTLNIVKAQKVVLEEKVGLRTQELETLNYEIGIQNKELQQQKEQIILLNESLEKMVEDRTAELSMALLDLEKRNLDLRNFSHVVTHNLRGPISSILGLIDLHELQRDGNPSQEDLLKYIKTTALSLDKVIFNLNQILAIKGAVVDERVSVDLVEVAERMKSLLATQIDASKAFIHLDFSQNEIQSIPAYLENIFYNLINNSIKYARPGVAPEITVLMLNFGESYRFVFNDNGSGIDIPEEKRDSIFKMFFRANNSNDGKGVGLYLVKCQVEALGGVISVHTTPGKGTTFIIDLPV